MMSSLRLLSLQLYLLAQEQERFLSCMHGIHITYDIMQGACILVMKNVPLTAVSYLPPVRPRHPGWFAQIEQEGQGVLLYRIVKVRVTAPLGTFAPLES